MRSRQQPRPSQLSLAEYVAGVGSCDRSLLGRAITLVESNHPDHRDLARALLNELLPASGGSHRVGITGVPGAGKSTLIESLGCQLIARGHRVAVLAVDPSSPLSGGSILGDKTRMTALAASDRAFVRPSPSRGSLGGVGRKTRETIILVEAAGFDVVLVETVGVGQSETLVAEMVDFFLVLLLAGAGDELQGIKRGILELADLLAINKADGDNRTAAARTRIEYARALRILRPRGTAGWVPPVLTCSGREPSGLEEIWESICSHRQLMADCGALTEKRHRQQIRWMWSLIEDQLRAGIREHPRVAAAIAELEQEVLEDLTTPTAAAATILELAGRCPGPARAES